MSRKAEVEQSFVAERCGRKAAAGNKVLTHCAIARIEHTVLNGDPGAPLLHIDQNDVLVCGLENKNTAALVLGFDGGFLSDGAAQCFAKEIADALGLRLDIAFIDPETNERV